VEARGFRSYGDEPGAIFVHECPEGIGDQTTFICEKLIPEALNRRPNRRLGDIAVLYLDKNDGSAIARIVDKMGWKYIRVDGNNPYQPSPDILA
jgi:DNA helicase-2/ATP-dependent DNA helicase PcrA